MKLSFEEERAAISPLFVADRVHHALTARRPRTRYIIGGRAKLIIVLRRLLPDRTFDGWVAGKFQMKFGELLAQQHKR